MEFEVRKYGKAIFSVEDSDSGLLFGCFEVDNKLVIRKGKLPNTTEKSEQVTRSSKLLDREFLYTIKLFINSDEFESLLKEKFEYSSYVLNSKNEININNLLEYIQKLEKRGMDISLNGFPPEILLLKLFIVQNTTSNFFFRANKLYLEFLEVLGVLPNSLGKVREFRNPENSNEEFKPNKLVKKIPITDELVFYIHQGSFSNYDMLLKYRVYENSNWSRIRAPKHIHWAVDLIQKKQFDNDLTDKFLKDLLEQWDKVESIDSNLMRNEVIESCIKKSEQIGKDFAKLDEVGEYPIRFLWVMAVLLMYQEKTNYSKAYMFQNLLESLKSEKGIYKIVSTATHR